MGRDVRTVGGVVSALGAAADDDDAAVVAEVCRAGKWLAAGAYGP